MFSIRPPLSRTLSALSVLLWSTVVLGAPPAVGADAAPPVEAAPVIRAVARGDRAFVAGDGIEAERAYQEALALDEAPGVAQLALATLYFSRGDFETALAALGSPEEWARRSVPLRARAVLLTALVHERRGAFTEAKEAWRAYAALGSAPPVFVATAERHQELSARAAQRSADYAVVRERIQKGIDFAESRTGKAAEK